MPQMEHNRRVRGNVGDGQGKWKHGQESDFSDAGTWGCAQVHLGWEKAALVNYGELTFLSFFSPTLL